MKPKTRKFKKGIRRLAIIAVLLFVVLNAFIAVHTHSLTHLHSDVPTLANNVSYDKTEVMKLLFTGLKIPKPISNTIPAVDYQQIEIVSEIDTTQKFEAWTMNTTDSVSKGIFILFHGYLGEKSMMLDRAYELLDMGYDVMLFDFMGSGGSYGKQTSIGYHEAYNVNVAYKYVQQRMNRDDIYLLGFSMGAAAITRAVPKYKLEPKAIVLEACYSSMLETVAIRLGRVTSINRPIAYLSTFWLGRVNKFNAFSMNPEEYVKEIKVPTLVLGGGVDKNVAIEETERIFENSASEKKEMKIFPESGHESYLLKYKDEWRSTLKSFLDNINTQ